MSTVAIPSLRRLAPLSRHVVPGLVAIVEAALVFLTSILICWIHILPTFPNLTPQYVTVSVFYVSLIVLCFKAAGLYQLERMIRPSRNWTKILSICGLIFFGLLTLGFVLKISANFSRVWAVASLVASVAVILAVRIAAAAIIRHTALAGALTKNIVIYGADENGERLIRHIEALHEPWNRIIGVFDDRSDRIPRECAGYPVVGGMSVLLEYAQLHPSDEVLLALPLARRDRIMTLMEQLSPLPANVRLVPDIEIFNSVQLPMSNEFGVPMLNILLKPVSGWGVLGKWAIDFGIGGLLLLLSLPVMAIVAVLIKLDSPGPVLFRQRRYGFQNQIIEVFKFRTMFIDKVDADAERLTTRNDPRVTRVGAWLRRLSLDELPQLINVLMGKMSLVGPRPHALKAKAGGKLYPEVIRSYAVRLKVKPGITGWAQVNGWRGNTETEEDLKGRVEHDIYYIENWSLGFDIYIILKTFLVVFKSENSY